MTARRWSACALLLLCVALPLSVKGISSTTYGGWPATGFAAALFFVAGRGRARTIFVLQTVAITIGLRIGYDLLPWQDVVGSLFVTVPGLFTAAMLGWGRGSEVRLDLVDSDRYHLVTALSALLGAVLGSLGILTVFGVREAAVAAVIAFLASLSAQLVVLPLVIGQSAASPVASPSELIALRVTMLLLGSALLWFESSGALLFVLFTLLGWAGRRASPREAHVMLFVICVAAYASAVLGHGPLVHAPVDLPDELAPALFYLFAVSACYLVVPMTLSVEEMVGLTRRAQRAATTVERLFDSAVGSVLIAVDEQGLVTHFNSGAQRALGYEHDELVGRSPLVLFSTEELKRQSELTGSTGHPLLAALATAEGGKRREWNLLRKDGTPRTLSLTLSVVHDADGRVLGLIASGEDISERLRGEQALAAALQRELASVHALQRVDQVKEDLVSTVSHELRTPITSIAGYAELLVDGMLGPLTEGQADALERIERNTKRLGILVEDLLTMSRSETGQLELDLRHVDLRTIVKEAFDTLRELCGDRQLRLELNVPREPVMVLGDRVALSRAVENLLTNAAKFTPDGGLVRLSVQEESSGHCSITVTDTGMGIPEEDLPHLFERFFRSSIATEFAIQGSGLGLGIVYAIVEQHGGEVSVDSTVGLGTSFTVRLPGLVSTPSAQLSLSGGSAARTA